MRGRLLDHARRLSRVAWTFKPPLGPRLNDLPLSPLQARIPLASIIVGATALGGVTYFGTDLLGSSASTKRLPPLAVAVPVLDAQTATDKLRTEEHTAYFDAGGGRRGQVFRIRLQSNCPTEDEWVDATADGQGGRPLSCWGVLDGHAGWATSTLLKQSLIPYLSAHLSPLKSDAPSSTLIATIKQSFLALDDNIMTTASAALSHPSPSSATISALAPAIAGSCALLTIYDPQTSNLLTACVGDSRAVLGRYLPFPTTTSYTAEPLSVDQTGKNPLEYQRIMTAHPDEPDCVNQSSGRVLGLAVTRAFGDSRWKWDNATQTAAQQKFFASAPRPGARPPAYLTAEPVVTETKVGQGDFVIVATDGLWDHFENGEAVKCVEKWVEGVKRGRVAKAEPGIREVYRPDGSVGGGKGGFELEGGSYATWSATEKDFVVEDGNAATHLVRNAFGGRRRGLFEGVMSTYAPISRNVRDDVTVFVVFFDDIGAPASKL